jgi:hypothetical protein
VQLITLHSTASEVARQRSGKSPATMMLAAHGSVSRVVYVNLAALAKWRQEPDKQLIQQHYAWCVAFMARSW